MIDKRCGAYLAALASAVLLSACASEAPAPVNPTSATSGGGVAKTDLLVSEFGWSKGVGTNTLSGVVAYHPQKGQRWTCASQAVALMPDVATSRTRILALYGSPDFAVRTVAEVREKAVAAGEPTFSAYVRQSTCDEADHFSFEQMPDGSYFIVARAHRSAPKAADDGIVIVQRVTLAGGKAISIRLPAF